jgi:hypothetical protein
MPLGTQAMSPIPKLCHNDVTRMRDLVSALKGILRWRSKQGALNAASGATAKPDSHNTVKAEPSLTLFSPEGNCLKCRNYRPRARSSAAGADHGAVNPNREAIANAAVGDSTINAAAEQADAFCSIRGFDIREPLTTFCKNFSAPNDPPMGAIYSILGTQGGVALPWVNLAAPRMAPATCCMCDGTSEAGVRLELAEDTVECCGPQHYLDWWTDYLCRRLDYFKLLGERAYSDMYDVISPSAATAYYSDAKEAFYSAISTARDLELRAEQHALEQRLAHIKAVFRSQFR